MTAHAQGTGGGGGPGFTAELSRRGPIAVVALYGELDHDGPQPLRDAIGQALAGGAERVLVDCTGLDFCDSTGLNTLLQGRLEALAAGSTLELAGFRPAVARLFEITGAGKLFTVHDTLPEEAG
ncbi:STAS domain-containing protein [Streptomyces toxytricini]|uniref:Anti-sigma factor antagonist n=1 Tax=Streptomyces toxytricini TaxID=67369 RepID=A0ABW8ECN2_STRT5